MYQKHELFGELSADNINETLKACTLDSKDEYMEDEADRFRECRALIEQGKTYKQAAAQFRKQDKLKQSGDAQPNADTLEMLELLALASEQVGGKISFIEAGKILDACSLPDKEEYTGAECDRFLQACTLAKQQGKSYQEVAAHFGVATTPDDSLERQELLAEVQEMQNSVSSLSGTQAMQVMQALPQMSLEQLRAIKLQFLRDLNRELREYISSGRMQAEFEANAQAVINEPLFDWSLTSNAHTRPLNGDAFGGSRSDHRPHKSLPGS